MMKKTILTLSALTSLACYAGEQDKQQLQKTEAKESKEAKAVKQASREIANTSGPLTKKEIQILREMIDHYEDGKYGC